MTTFFMLHQNVWRTFGNTPGHLRAYWHHRIALIETEADWNITTCRVWDRFDLKKREGGAEERQYRPENKRTLFSDYVPWGEAPSCVLQLPAPMCSGPKSPCVFSLTAIVACSSNPAAFSVPTEQSSRA